MSSSLRDDLIVLSRAIHATPELAYQEHEAATRIAAFLEKERFRVTRRYRGVETSYRAHASGAGSGPRASTKSSLVNSSIALPILVSSEPDAIGTTTCAGVFQPSCSSLAEASE